MQNRYFRQGFSSWREANGGPANFKCQRDATRADRVIGPHATRMGLSGPIIPAARVRSQVRTGDPPGVIPEFSDGRCLLVGQSDKRQAMGGWIGGIGPQVVS